MSAISRSASVHTFRLGQAPSYAFFFWVCLWCNLNTGFYNISFADNLNDWQLAIRGAIPFVVLPAAGFFLLRPHKPHLPGKPPTRLLMVYGSIATVASRFSPDPMASLYWSLPFLA